MKPNRSLRTIAHALATLLCATAYAVEVQTNLDYIADTDYADNKDRLDLYVPDDAENAPVVLFIHGGGLMAGSKDGASGVGQRLASAGFVAACTNYRLSPSVSHPAHIEDIAAAFAWLHTHAAEYGGDPDKCFVVGHSAGAYLAALLATDEQYLSQHELGLSDIRGAVPISGFFHVDRIAPGRSKSIWGEQGETWSSASPANQVSNAAPPLLLLYADGDAPERKAESIDFAATLNAAGARASCAEIADRTHVTLITKFRGRDDDTAAKAIAFIRERVEADSN